MFSVFWLILTPLLHPLSKTRYIEFTGSYSGLKSMPNWVPKFVTIMVIIACKELVKDVQSLTMYEIY